MSDEWKRRVAEIFAESIELHRTVAAGGLDPVVHAARLVLDAVSADGKLLICGNGGSASDAQHVAAELVGRFRHERRALPAIALTVDTSILTSIANDYSYEQVFSRQIAAIGGRRDVLLAISTSGRSPNVHRAIEEARKIGMKCIALTGGDGGSIGVLVDVHINVPGLVTARTQEVHRTILHALCDLVDSGFAAT